MNSWQQKEAAQATLAKEVGYIRKPHTDRLRVALAFPNTYYVGMSNLGFQTVYQLFNAHDDVVCERIFLPPKQQLKEQLASRTPLITLESQSLARDFDVIAFSVSFEWDYTNILTMLRLAGVPVRAADRTPRDPLVVIGGAVTFVNPEPLALFADVIAAGEGEVLVPGLIESLSRRGRSPRSAEVARAEARVLHSVVLRRRVQGRRHDRSSSFRRKALARRPCVKKAAVPTTEALDPPCTRIFTPDTEFGSRFLVEVVRGCANLCRFCWAGYNYLPVRAFPADRILERAREARAHAKQAGLVSIALVRSPGDRSHPDGAGRHGLFDQPGLAAARRPDRNDRAPASRERRKDADDRAGNRIRPPAPRHQQDGDERRDSRSRRADLLERHREPEAVLHDRPADRDRRRSRGHSRSDAADARHHAEAREEQRAHRPHHRAA